MFVQQTPEIVPRRRDYRSPPKDTQQTAGDYEKDLSTSSMTSSSSHYSHRSFVSLADFYLDPAEPDATVSWDLTHPAGHDSGLNSILVGVQKPCSFSQR